VAGEKPDPTAPKVGKPRWRIALWITLFLGLSLFCGTTYDNFRLMGIRAKRVEAALNVPAIREAELAYFSRHGSFLAAPPTPARLNEGGTMTFEPGERWQALDWSPDGAVRCQYEVTVAPDGQDFVARGRCDVDQDGEFAIYEATRAGETTRVSPSTAY
jgi:hypothetical protein